MFPLFSQVEFCLGENPRIIFAGYQEKAEIVLWLQQRDRNLLGLVSIVELCRNFYLLLQRFILHQLIVDFVK